MPPPTASPETPARLANKRHQRHPPGPQPRVETATAHTVTPTASTSPGASCTSTRGPHHGSSTKHRSKTTTSRTLTTSVTSGTLRQEWRGENPTTRSHPASPAPSPLERHPTHHRHRHQRHRPLTHQPHSPHKRHQPNSHRHHLHHPHQRQSPVNHLRPRTAGTKSQSIADNTPGQHPDRPQEHHRKQHRQPTATTPSQTTRMRVSLPTPHHLHKQQHHHQHQPKHQRRKPHQQPTPRTTAATHQSRHPPSAPPTNACSSTSGHPTSDITLRQETMISTSRKASP